jgi:hypothetical protein
VPVYVQNLGGGAAVDVVVVTSWGEGAIGEPIPPGGEARVKVGIPRHEWDALPADEQWPRMLSIRFRDAAGADDDVKLSE